MGWTHSVTNNVLCVVIGSAKSVTPTVAIEPDKQIGELQLCGWLAVWLLPQFGLCGALLC